MIRLILLAMLLSVPAFAQQDPTPEVATLLQLLREAQQREAAAVYRAITAERRVPAAETKTETPKP
jgi:hypothetical protein